MARILTPPAIAPAFPRRQAARPAQAKVARHIAPSPVSVLGVWRDALAAFGANSAGVLLCAVLGFAAPVIAGHWLAALPTLSNYAWVGPVVVLSEKPSAAAVFVLAAVWLLSSSFARGVMTWLVMCSDGRRSAGAIRMTLARYPALLAGSLVYGAFVLACIVGMNLLALGVQPDAGEAKVLPVWSGLPRAWGDATHQLAGRSINQLMPDAGSPLAALLIDLELALSPSSQANQVTQYEQWLTEAHGESAMAPARQPRHASERWFIAAASLALLVLAEPLLRFRTVMAFKPSRSRQVPELPGGVGPRRFAAITALFDSARFGLRHFGVVMRHIWVTRIVIVALCLGLVELPLALMDAVILPNVVGVMGKSQLLPLLNFAQVSTAALVSALALAFGAVYDARLYAALDGNGVATA